MPTRTFDDDGRHVAVCRRLPLDAMPIWRHDRMTELLAAISRTAGRGGATHDRPVIPSSGVRPADFMEAPTGPTTPMGHMVDYTNVAGSRADVKRAEDAKSAKYAPYLPQLPGFSWEPFGTAEDGSLGPGAVAVCDRWISGINAASRSRGRGYLIDAELAVRRTVGRAFALTAAAQLAKYLNVSSTIPARGAATAAVRAKLASSPSRRGDRRPPANDRPDRASGGLDILAIMRKSRAAGAAPAAPHLTAGPASENRKRVRAPGCRPGPAQV